MIKKLYNSQLFFLLVRGDFQSPRIMKKMISNRLFKTYQNRTQQIVDKESLNLK